MKKTPLSLSTIKQLDTVKEVKKSEMKGGSFINIFLAAYIQIPKGVIGRGLGFVPPPGM